MMRSQACDNCDHFSAKENGYYCGYNNIYLRYLSKCPK